MGNDVNMDKTLLYKCMFPWLGRGLITIQGLLLILENNDLHFEDLFYTNFPNNHTNIHNYVTHSIILKTIKILNK